MREGLEALSKEAFDVVLTDLNLPDSSGLATLGRVLETGRDVPVVVLSGGDDEAVALEAVARGAQDYLIKGEATPNTIRRALRFAFERHRLLSLLEEKNRQLAQRNQELDEFAQVVSHDLKAPLRGIALHLQMLREELPADLSPPAVATLQAIHERAERLSRMIAAILDYCRAGRRREPEVALDPAPLIGETIELLQPPPGFRIDVACTAGPFAAPRVQLQQVLANLIGNAMKHHDRPQGAVRVSVQPISGAIEFVVEDDGPGIPEDRRGGIFNLFEPRAPRPDSTGAGLAIAKRIVEAHGGTIRVEAAMPRGARFRFTWPLLHVAEPAPAPAPELPARRTK